jgi:hypothetical protein
MPKGLKWAVISRPAADRRDAAADESGHEAERLLGGAALRAFLEEQQIALAAHGSRTLLHASACAASVPEARHVERERHARRPRRAVRNS